MSLSASTLLLPSIFPLELELLFSRVSRKHFWCSSTFRTKNIHIHNIPFKQELQIALDCTPRWFTVDLIHSKMVYCWLNEMHELQIEQSLSTHGFLRCNIQSVNSTLRTSRALNNLYKSDKLKDYSTDCKGTWQSVRIERTEFALSGLSECGCIGHGWRRLIWRKFCRPLPLIENPGHGFLVPIWLFSSSDLAIKIKITYGIAVDFKYLKA